MNVPLLNTALFRFFVASVTLHTLAFTLFYLAERVRISPQESIPVTLLPPQENKRSDATRIPRASTPSRPTKAPTIVAKKDSPSIREKTNSGKERIEKSDYARQEPKRVVEPPPAREPVQENTVVAERELPSLKDLLPPPSWSSSSARSAAPVSLNTRDPIYVTYFNKIKQSIESHWEYPEMALRYGLQGKLSLEFTIGGNGQLEQLRLIRTSGSQLLDQEAMRAIKAASPFPPIPPWIKPNPLSISASMEYHDNRLNYRFSP